MARMTIKAARVNAGLCQKEAAKRLNISNKTLCAWETYKSYPTVDKLPLICEVYNIRCNDLIFLPNNPLKGDFEPEAIS